MLNRGLDGGGTLVTGRDTSGVVAGQASAALVGWHTGVGVSVHVALVLALSDELIVGIVVGEDGVGLAKWLSAKPNENGLIFEDRVSLIRDNLDLPGTEAKGRSNRC